MTPRRTPKPSAKPRKGPAGKTSLAKPSAGRRSSGGRSADQRSAGRRSADKRSASQPAADKRSADRRSADKRSASQPAAGNRSRGRPGGKRTVGGEQVEGRHAVLELLMAGARRVHEVWVSSEVSDAEILQDIRELAESQRVPVSEVGRSKLAARARTEVPQGVLALAAPLPEFSLEDLLSGRRLVSRASRSRGERPATGAAPFLVALDGVTDPGNLGAVLRSAECGGASGVLLPRHRAVNVTPTVAKAAAGAIEHLPIAPVGGLPSALAQLRSQDVLTVGLDSAAEQSVYDLPPVDGAVCLVLGAEGRGLSRLVRQRCDVVAQIPLHGQLASLNVSVAGALACFEIARRRLP